MLCDNNDDDNRLVTQQEIRYLIMTKQWCTIEDKLELRSSNNCHGDNDNNNNNYNWLTD